MKHYIPYTILINNQPIEHNENTKIFMKIMKLTFNWANEMGLKGKRVSDIHFTDPSFEMGPSCGQIQIICKIECTEEERNIWEENMKLSIFG